MAFLLIPLPRAATSTIWSTNVLLNNIFSHNTLHFNHTMVLFSYLCTSTKSIRCTLTYWRLQPFSYLASPLNFGTNSLYQETLLATNNLNNLSTAPKVPAPQQGFPTAPRNWKQLVTLLALLLIADHHALLTTSVLSPSRLSTRLPLWRLQYLLVHINSSWNSHNNFMAENDFWLQIALTTLSASNQMCQHHIQGALLTKKSSEQTNATSGISNHR